MDETRPFLVTTRTGAFQVTIHEPQAVPDGGWEAAWSVTQQGGLCVGGGTTVCCASAEEVIWQAEVAAQDVINRNSVERTA
ncbi:MAG TPA: hypothetical protein VLM37_07815 [Fibrobacteraceae bacterium]|nr:hypothetical protein [Fibrobacteraceae bacterium]